MNQNNYIVSTLKSWNVAQFSTTIQSLPGTWHLITNPSELTIEYIDSINPKFIFFPHWSHKVPTEITGKYECICFHETDVPYGRGGSPIQNLIASGHTETVITALRMTNELDAGPVYIKRHLSLLGLAEEIFIRSSAIIFEMIRTIVLTEPMPKEQEGEPTLFARRTPEQSAITKEAITLSELFDHIRMLDAEGYPRAFINHGNFRLEFSRPALRTDNLEASVTIIPINKKG